LVGVPVRKPPGVLTYLLQTLAWQQLRIQAEITYIFVPNFGNEPHRDAALALLVDAQTDNTIVWPNVDAPEGDYGERAETRQWSPLAFARMAALKNRLLQHAMDERYDFVWLLDADVMCDPGTLQSMLDAAGHDSWLLDESRRIPIVCAVYWTRWQRKQPDSTDAVHAGPQVWLVHPYGLSGRGWTEAQFRSALVRRQRLSVGGLGACTLIPVQALQHGVSFARYDVLPQSGGMSEGEDRHFCAWATAKHVPLVADAWPDIWHAYHPHEYEQLPDCVAALRYESTQPKVGDLVSGKVEMLEPTPDANGRMCIGVHRWIRGILGALPVLPQISETLARLTPGQHKLVKLHFPAEWPHTPLRLQSRLARVTLFDTKPFRLPPVIDREHLVGGNSFSLLDGTQHTQEQMHDLTRI